MKYVQVVRWSAKADGIELEMLGEDQQVHRFEVGAACAGVLAAALAAESAKLQNVQSEQQFIRPKGMQTGKTEQDEPILFMRLEGGVELPLVFKRESLGVLISELQGLERALQPGSQIRWN